VNYLAELEKIKCWYSIYKKMSSKSLVPEVYSKPAIAALVAFSIDRFVLKQSDMKKSAIFGLSVAGGITAGKWVGKNVPIVDSPSTFLNEKQIAQRTIEVSTGVASAYAVNRFVMRNTGGPGLVRQAGTVLVADYVSEIVCDWAAGRKIGYLV
jgi:hypothetical protein